MNCETARNRLMALPDPAAASDALAAHVDACSACQAWSRLLAQVEEGIVATAPAPGSGRVKRQLVAQFREAGPAVKAKPAGSGSRILAAIQPAPVRPTAGERLARLWPAGLVAAALLLGVLVWSSLQKPNDGTAVAALPPDPFLDKAVAAKVKLDAAPDAVARLAVLDSLQQSIREEATSLSKVTPGSDMESLARMYEQVVAEGMVEQARLMTADERKAKLPAYTNRLSAAEQEANRMAAEAPPGADRPLKGIARAAEKGRIELARMIQG